MRCSRALGRALLLTGLAISRPSVAQVPPAVMPVHAAAPPSNLSVGTQYFEGNFDGFRAYLDSVRPSDPQLYAALNPKLTALEEQRTLGTVVMWSSAAVGLGIAAWGVAQATTGGDDSKCDTLPFDERSACRTKATDEMTEAFDQGLVFIAIGFGVGLGGMFAGLALKPGRSDLLSLVNEHNRARPNNPMRLQLGFDPNAQRARVGLSLDFDVTQLW